MRYLIGILISFVIFMPMKISANSGSFKIKKLHRVFTKVLGDTESMIDASQFSKDGKYILAYGDRSRVFLWRTSDFRLFRKYKFIPDSYHYPDKIDKKVEDHSSIVGVNFIPHSQKIFVGFRDGYGLIIDLLTNKRTGLMFTNKTGVASGMAISESGNILALGLGYYDRKNRKLIRDYSIIDNFGYSLHSNIDYFGYFITNDDKLLITGVSRFPQLYIVDFRKRRCQRLTIEDLNARYEMMSSLELSPDNNTVAVGLNNGQVRICSIRLNKEIKRISVGGDNPCAGFTPDGKLLYASNDKDDKIIFWSTSDWKKKHLVRSHDKTTISIWLLDGKYLGFGTESGSFLIKELATGNTVLNQQVTDSAISSIDYLSSKHLFLFTDKNYRISVFKAE
jgi:WD40 repeat protein